ncbi:DUF1893 domain-containing protein [Xylanibacter muris]|uniref:DUF1893 domain-containing protein n=1 Tax=Xylanibacter muris TaxID=2736290 RepID=A0ABX2ALN7_9BACT|nr:DUF1893 domain-containing protein [Xylanibacter muris]NPD90851.1 DUF1893 domain-containing protein [Xylanibacter muris]
MNELKTLLHEGNYSCVIRNANGIHTFTQRGVADLYDIYCNRPEYLYKASIADKVVGKGAAALMILGKVKTIYADVISSQALMLLKTSGVEINFDREVPHIINRTGTGRCPLETACDGIYEPKDMFPVIKEFIETIRKHK